jgi:hypothetical protein
MPTIRNNGRLDMIEWRVLLDNGYVFTFDVQDWDVSSNPLSNEKAHAMAQNLIAEGTPLYGKLTGVGLPSAGVGVYGVMEAEHVIAVLMSMPEPATSNRRGRR